MGQSRDLSYRSRMLAVLLSRLATLLKKRPTNPVTALATINLHASRSLRNPALLIIILVTVHPYRAENTFIGEVNTLFLIIHR